MKRAAVFLALWSAGCASGPSPGYVARAEFGEKWPLTVEEGELHCTETPTGLSVNRKAVTFTSGGRTYAVNGSARGQGIPDIDPIVKQAPQETSSVQPVARFSEQERRAIFAESVGCEEKADEQAQAKYPNPNDVRQQLELNMKLTESCNAALKKRYKLTEHEYSSISEEGVTLAWPPFTPMRMSLQPLIERGLKLCKSPS